jgi:hypothetical protein
MKKGAVVILVIIVMLLSIGGTLVYQKYVGKGTKVETTTTTTTTTIAEDQILKLSNTELDNYLKYLNGLSNDQFFDFDYNVTGLSDKDTSIPLNTNLFTSQKVKNYITCIIGKLTLKEVRVDELEKDYYVTESDFKPLYEKIIGETYNVSKQTIDTNGVLISNVGSGRGVAHYRFASNGITKSVNTYTIKLVVSKFNDTTTKYEVQNDLVGRINFEKSGDTYHIISFIVSNS